MSEIGTAVTGGCQCGAIRYRLTARPKASICFCRMCQKAAGHYFGAFAGVALGELVWTRGEPALFASSEAAERGFCPSCGTPLTFAYRGSGRISVTAGSLDDPSAFPPVHAHGIEGKVPWFEALGRLPGRRTEDDLPEQGRERYRSRQHPDRDI
ncbi:MAG: aldehyde-activating protein [Chelatococcus sp.]|nr:MAG: aldehyde-activating protein [Chelatococcus sp.]